MPLTPSDVHNVVFNRPRFGRRGYREDEVDLFLELVEDALTQHLEEKEDLRKRNARLRERNAVLEKATAELREWDAKLRRRREQLRRHEETLHQQAAQLLRYKAALERAIEQRQLEAPRDQRQAALPRGTDKVRKRRTAMPARSDGHSGTANTQQSISSIRSIAGAFGKHDLEWMAIRSLVERVKQAQTETVDQEWTGNAASGHGGGDVIPIESAQIQQLRQKNEELKKINDMLKTLTAVFAAEVGSTRSGHQGQIGS